MKKPTQHLIAEVPCRQVRTELTVGVDFGDVWSHYCTLNQDGEVVDRGIPELGLWLKETAYGQGFGLELWPHLLSRKTQLAARFFRQAKRTTNARPH